MERKSERMDTAYSPRLQEEELSAAASRILLRVIELWLENIGCGIVASESFLDSTRRMVESWLGGGCGRVEVPDGWRGVGKRLLDGWGNGCEKVVVEWRLVVSVSVLGNGCIVAELALRSPKVGRMSVRGRGKGALPCATRL